MKIIKRFKDLDSYNPLDIIPFFTAAERSNLWINYLYNHSGQKEESPLLENFIFENVPAPASILGRLTTIISVNFLDKWTRIYDALMLEYGVIDNYNRIEDTEVNASGESNGSNEVDASDTMSGGHSNAGSDIINGGHTSTKNGTGTNKVSAYNVDTFSNKEEDITSDTDALVYNNETTAHSDTFTYNDETKTTKSTANTHGDTSNNTITHSVVKGNIGVTTSQQMLLSEFELRQYNLIDVIYKDLDSILCTAVYDI